MSWRADQVYFNYNQSLIEHFQNIEYSRDKIFHVNDLEGIRSEWTRDFMLNDKAENSHLKHGLPKEGIVTLMPDLRRNLFNNSDKQFLEIFKYSRNEKWKFLESEQRVPLDVKIPFELIDAQIMLLDHLNFLHQKYQAPILYYFSETWGGSTEVEFAFVFDHKTHIYFHDVDLEKNFVIVEDVTETSRSVLENSFQYLGLNLPSPFFALHETSFDWKQYWIK